MCNFLFAMIVIYGPRTTTARSVVPRHIHRLHQTSYKQSPLSTDMLIAHRPLAFAVVVVVVVVVTLTVANRLE